MEREREILWLHRCQQKGQCAQIYHSIQNKTSIDFLQLNVKELATNKNIKVYEMLFSGHCKSCKTITLGSFCPSGVLNILLYVFHSVFIYICYYENHSLAQWSNNFSRLINHLYTVSSVTERLKQISNQISYCHFLVNIKLVHRPKFGNIVYFTYRNNDILLFSDICYFWKSGNSKCSHIAID